MKNNLRQIKISADRVTLRDENIDRYFREVERQPLMSLDEEFRIGMLAQAGDEAAVHRLVNSNLRFVVSVAKQYSGNAQPLSEMIAQGNLGLVHAARTFDPTRGFKFISYAVWHIRKEILLYLSQNARTVKLPQNVITDLAAIRRVESSYIQKEGRLPTPIEIEDELVGTTRAMNAEKIQSTLEVDFKSTPLEDTSDEDGYGPIAWLSNNESTSSLIEKENRSDAVKLILNALSQTQKLVISMRLGLVDGNVQSFSDIGKRIDRTPECARQIFNKGIKDARSKILRSKRNREEFCLFDV